MANDDTNNWEAERFNDLSRETQLACLDMMKHFDIPICALSDFFMHLNKIVRTELD